MKNTLLFCLIAASATLYGDSVVPNDKQYYKYLQENVEIIYTKDNLPYAVHTASIENKLNQDYENFFGWKLDETLFVGLISDHNQIANGFSSQWPRNRQINYLGGTQLIDTFCATSWLDTLLYHETAHNYQLNVKGHEVSQLLHEVLGNGSLMFPYLIMPNVVESSFMLEGNAVLNESWHGNGGRLYSGVNKAQTILQAQAGKLTPQNLYNVSLEFPYYYDLWYIQGGFFNLYLAQKYGLENVNGYFKNKSLDFYWPFFTNVSMERALGVDFEEALKDFEKEYKEKGEKFIAVGGEKIAASKIFYQLNGDTNEIYFLTNESGVRAPELVTVDKKAQSVQKRRGAWSGGKVIKKEGEYVTQGSGYTSVFMIHQGLFDESGTIKEGTESKMVQGYLRDGREVYFDVPSSYMQANLYVAGEFYDTCNSSVFIDASDNLYYFKQDQKRRTLYKNTIPLYSYEGFYGIVMDVDKTGGVYFIANSKNGSSLYRVYKNQVERMLAADNIVEAKLLSQTQALVAAIGSEEYYYTLAALEPTNEAPFEEKLFFESEPYYGAKEDSSYASKIGLQHPYDSLFEMHYGGTNLYATSTEETVSGSIDITFADPLMQNSASLYVFRDENNVTLAGGTYTNSQYLLEYSLSGYRVLNNGKMDNVRDYGVAFDLFLPFYKSGYNEFALHANYSQDYEDREREPLHLDAGFESSYGYGMSMYLNYLQAFHMYYSRLDNDAIYGARYTFEHDLPYEFYVGMEVKKSVATADVKHWRNGIKVTNATESYIFDPSRISVPSFSKTYYFQEGAYVEGKVYKVLNFSSYWFTFPVSLQRESLYAKLRRYDLKYYDEKYYCFNEATLGATFSSVWFNKGVVPLSFEYIVNDADFLEEKYKIRFTVDLAF